MVWMTLLGWLVTITCIVVLVAILISDADLTLSYYARFGSNQGATLKDKVVWITGASSGIGEELAYQLAEIGSKLVLSARRKSELERVKKTCLERGQCTEEDIMIIPLDMCVFDSHGSATQKVIAKFNQIDVLVNNAGRTQRSLAIETSLQVDKESLNVNLLGPVSLTKAVLPHMIANKSGHIVVTSSIAGKCPATLQTAYSAAKFAVQGFFDVLRTEVYSDNITVTTVLPGPVVSNVVQSAMTTSVEKSAKDAGIDAALQYPNRMPTDRCAKLMVIGMANKLDELWISKQPMLLLAYMAQYMPMFCRFILMKFGKQRIQAMKAATVEKKTQ
ncbi:dehydrogenase/reductase SDR family member 7-like [Glandiceps talaboti]